MVAAPDPPALIDASRSVHRLRNASLHEVPYSEERGFVSGRNSGRTLWGWSSVPRARRCDNLTQRPASFGNSAPVSCSDFEQQSPGYTIHRSARRPRGSTKRAAILRNALGLRRYTILPCCIAQPMTRRRSVQSRNGLPLRDSDTRRPTDDLDYAPTRFARQTHRFRRNRRSLRIRNDQRRGC